MVYCSVPFCTSNSTKDQISFHQIPAKLELREKWLIAISREGIIKGSKWNPSQYSAICGKHFHPGDFKPYGKIKILKPNVVPSVFPGYPDHFKHKQHKPRWKIMKALVSASTPNHVQCDKISIVKIESKVAEDTVTTKEMLKSIIYDGTTLEVLDQLLLPHETKYEKVANVDEGWEVIRSMKVRGAPAISIVGALSLAVELKSSNVPSKNELHKKIKQRLDHLVTARPTAVNLKQVANTTVSHSLSLLQDAKVSLSEMKNRVIEEIEKLMKKDISVNKSIGLHGGTHILSNADGLVTVLTHCNTGSLATAGYGTALGVIRWLHEQKRLSHVYFTETRPYNQGARLTAYELIHDHIPATLICDSMVSALLHTKKITAVVVGADRVAANGDTANKIGTYHIAISAQYHGVPFYVASPTSTLDMTLENGSLIPVEERPHSEMTTINSQRIAPDGINCWNPAFDVTPAELITGGIVTEHGVFPADSLKKLEESLKAL